MDKQKINEQQFSEKQYEQIYRRVIDYEQGKHQKNQKKIKIGLKINIWLPAIFLVISFLTSASKLIFLVLWIVTLFGIAFYLMYVEYSDYQSQERMKELGVCENNLQMDSLIGAPVEVVESQVAERMDEIDDKMEEDKQKVAEAIDQTKQKAQQRREQRHEENRKKLQELHQQNLELIHRLEGEDIELDEQEVDEEMEDTLTTENKEDDKNA